MKKVGVQLLPSHIHVVWRWISLVWRIGSPLNLASGYLLQTPPCNKKPSTFKQIQCPVSKTLQPRPGAMVTGYSTMAYQPDQETWIIPTWDQGMSSGISKSGYMSPSQQPGATQIQLGAWGDSLNGYVIFTPSSLPMFSFSHSTVHGNETWTRISA